MSFTSPEFWIALSQIMLINIVLSGDNAVVIAMASRSLSPSQQKKAILFGSATNVTAESTLAVLDRRDGSVAVRELAVGTARSLAACDVDGDGRTDLLLADAAHASVRTLLLRRS